MPSYVLSNMPNKIEYPEGLDPCLYEIYESAINGDSSSQDKLGLAYFNGNDVPKSGLEAYKWFKKAAEQDCANAQFYLGFIYAVGFGVEKSYPEAINWFRLAADQGNYEAQYYLGILFEEGKGVEQSYSESVKWYRLAADQGYAVAEEPSPNISMIF